MIQKAQYVPRRSEMRGGNPLIEALPPHRDQAEVFKMIRFRPNESPKDMQDWTDGERLDAVDELRFFFEPMPRHFDLASGIFSLMESGYMSRRPAWGTPIPKIPRRSLHGGSLFGPSGTGKTTALRAILDTIPQVIHHSKYNGVDVNETQVTWLLIDCSPSTRGICADFFQKLGKIVGQDFLQMYGGTKGTATTMVPAMATLLKQYHVGLVIIDEFQSLFSPGSGQSKDEVKDFIVRIGNSFDTPVVTVGTVASGMRMTDEFRTNRRSTGLHCSRWPRLNKIEFDCFVRGLWKFRYVTKPHTPSPNFTTFLFELTQGIPDLIVKLYIVAQRHAIDTGLEDITPELLMHVYNTAFLEVHDYLEQLRKGDEPKDDYELSDSAILYASFPDRVAGKKDEREQPASP